MSDVAITIRLPKELVERAQAVGIQVDNVTEAMIEVIEKQIARKAALGRLLSIAEQIDSLPDSLKPTHEEIEAEIKASRDEDPHTDTPVIEK
jgi:hypothetical protein